MAQQGTNGNGISGDLQAKRWAASNKLRGYLDAAEYKHVVLVIIFLKYISNAFQEFQGTGVV
jgi:type I restriction enzyme M protein